MLYLKLSKSKPDARRIRYLREVVVVDAFLRKITLVFRYMKKLKKVVTHETLVIA